MGWLVGHFVGDYLIQNDWMASQKKSDSIVCAIHVLFYTLAVMLFSGWFFYKYAPLIALAIYIPHYLIDRTQFIYHYMTLAGQGNFREYLKPWSSIWVDQSFHFLCLYLLSLVIE
jgi:hypothetical protein